jgi:hypothetical protein
MPSMQDWITILEFTLAGAKILGKKQECFSIIFESHNTINYG